MKKLKKRRPIVALLLSFATPGLGQIYNGQIKKALILYLIALFWGLVSSFFLIFNFYVGIFSFAIGICFFVFILYDAVHNSSILKQIVLKPYNKWYFYIIIILVSDFVISPSYSNFIKHNIVQAYKIPSSTMEPSLLVGDHILVNKFIYYFKDPGRGDIIVFVYPMDPKKDFVKRVIALPGEEVQLRNRRLFINGREIEDPWGIYGKRGGTLIPDHLRPRNHYGPKVVPSNSLFVLGDNRDNSQDSRYWGFVDRSKVKGRVSTIYFSWDRRTKRCRWERVGKAVPSKN